MELINLVGLIFVFLFFIMLVLVCVISIKKHRNNKRMKAFKGGNKMEEMRCFVKGCSEAFNSAVELDAHIREKHSAEEIEGAANSFEASVKQKDNAMQDVVLQLKVNRENLPYFMSWIGNALKPENSKGRILLDDFSFGKKEQPILRANSDLGDIDFGGKYF